MSEASHTLVLRPTGKYRSKGEVYEVSFNGEVIATGTSPECAACRVLQSRGLEGDALFWREGKRNYDLKLPIAWAAGKYVSEDKTGVRFSKWSPFKIGKEADDLEEAA